MPFGMPAMGEQPKFPGLGRGISLSALLNSSNWPRVGFAGSVPSASLRRVFQVVNVSVLSRSSFFGG